LTILILALYNI